VSSEGRAFWVIRTSPLRLDDFLWSKFWSGLIPILVLSLTLTVAANEFLAVVPVLKVVTAVGIGLMSLALVGLATGLGARYPRFTADNATQAAGSPGGIGFMMAAVAYILAMVALLAWPSSAYLWRMSRIHIRPFHAYEIALIVTCLTAAVLLSVFVFAYGMRSGVKALEEME
jgi:ABC-2 type transport system permease protein